MIRVTDRPATERSGLTTYAIDMMARLLVEMEDAYRDAAPGAVFSSLPEYGRLIDGAYALGFVCTDYQVNQSGRVFETLLRDPDRIDRASLLQLRRFITFMMRAERNSDYGPPDGGGFIKRATTARAFRRIAARLRGLAVPAEDR